MRLIKEDAINREAVQPAIKYLAAFSALIFLPFIIHIQWLNGPVVNAILIYILFIIGRREALTACFVPSIMALAGGLLPLPLTPMVPFIIISNIIYILAIDYLFKETKNEQTGYWSGILAGSFLKYFFIFAGAQFIGQYFITGKLTIALTQMVSWPQFATAFLGGMIAWIVLKWQKRF